MTRKYWNKQLCAEEALKYKTKTDFNRGSVGAYTHALKHGFLDEICSHMEVKWQRKWSNKDVCRKEALKYQTRSEFQYKSNGAYTYAMRHYFLDEICNHMENHHEIKWNSKEACAKEALKYKRRIDFARDSNSAYTYALKHGFLDEICSHMTFYGILSKEKELARINYVRKNIVITDEEWEKIEILLENVSSTKYCSNRLQRHRCIYACEFEDNHVYIGLANNLRQRIMQHLRTPSSSIYRYIIETGLIPTFKIIRGFESEKKAQKNEAEVEKMYKENGWCILNRAKTGALGGSYIYWTLERCLIVAKLATSMSDFCKRFRGAYASCKRNNWIPQIRQIVPQHVTPKRKTKIWSLDALKNEALKYQRKKDFKANSSSAYNYAKKHDLLNAICTHMPSPQSKYSFENLRNEAQKYHTRKEFKVGSPKFFDAAKRKNMLEEICVNMVNGESIYWTKERCKERALLYKTKMEFKHNDGSAYTTSVREGWLNELCQHMSAPTPQIKWTYEKLQETALLYHTRKEFKLAAHSAYVTAVKRKILDTICSHMSSKRTHKK